MCNIWKEEPGPDLEISLLERLPSYLREIDLTGGEPFLRDDLCEIVEAITQRCNSPKICISTNGFLTDRILSQMDRILRINPRVGLGISLDAVGALHDEIRGIPHAYEKVCKTIDALKKMGVADLRLSYVAQDKNVEELGKVYSLANELGLELTWVVAQNSAIYFKATHNRFHQIQALRKQVNAIISQELKSFQPRRIFRGYFAYGMYHYACTGKRLLPCDAGKGFFFIDPNGDVYPCNFLDRVMGNLRESDFEEIWNSWQAREIREFVYGCHRCWLVCTAASAIKRNIFKTGSWVAWNKIKAHLGMESFLNKG
jgi:radical SAM protein with 4Fe4S-binding SPASM domain